MDLAARDPSGSLYTARSVIVLLVGVSIDDKHFLL